MPIDDATARLTSAEATSPDPTSRELTARDLAFRIVDLCEERRGEDLVVLDIRELVDYMDFLVIGTARSERQGRAISEHVVREVKRAGHLPLSRAGIEAGSWICLDYVDVVLHVFTPETRAKYDLELLWADAERVERSSG